MYSMSQSERMYVSQQSPLEYLASSVQYSIRNSHGEDSANLSFQPSYQVALRSASPALYGGSVIYSVSSEFTPQRYNSAKEYTRFQTIHTEYHFLPDNFIRPGKEGAFIADAEEIRPFIEQTFQNMFNLPFPNNINVRILNEKEFRKIAPHPGTIGLSLNRTKQGGISEIFVLQDSLARVMLTIGHELGHVLTETLADQHDEEAKAYAFSLAWMKSVKDHNIANLGDAIVLENPAQNGLHNISFVFVQKMLAAGKNVWRLYLDLIGRDERVMSDSLLSVKNL